MLNERRFVTGINKARLPKHSLLIVSVAVEAGHSEKQVLLKRKDWSHEVQMLDLIAQDVQIGEQSIYLGSMVA